jgi:DNA-binding PadR family transcriptional regulator
LTNAELAVLSLLAEQASHGYDLEAKIEGRGMRDWTEIGFSSIYAILKKLEQQGYIEVERAESVGQGAPRKVYRITSSGGEAYVEATLEALSRAGRPNSSLLLGLANLPAVPLNQAVEALGAYCSALETRLEQLLTRAEEQQPLPDFVQAMFDYSAVMIATELAWLNDYIETLEA